MSAVAEERRPGREWDEVPFPSHVMDRGVQVGSAWTFGPLRVISTLTMAELPDGSGDVGPQWHISITDAGKRPKPKQVRRALRAFDMVNAEEDNHHPGNARHFWLPVDTARRVDCECKAEEVTIVEPDGYRYTNPHDPAECRGCDLERLIGKPCPLHKDSGQQQGKPVEDSPVLRSNASIEDATTPSIPTGATAGNVTTSRDDPGSAPCVVGPAAGRATYGGAVGR